MTKIVLTLLLITLSSLLFAQHIVGTKSKLSNEAEKAFANTFEPIDKNDYFYEDNNLIVWFDFSAGGFPRGFWLKDKKGNVLKSLNTNGELVPTNLTFGGGYQLLVACGNRPDSPTENFTIFGESLPTPAFGKSFTRKGKGFTELGFQGQMFNRVITTENGFDPNTMEITHDKQVLNKFANDSWSKNTKYWVHTQTDEKTKLPIFEKMIGTGEEKTISYKITFKVFHNQQKIESYLEVYLFNNPNVYAVLTVLDTWDDYAPDGNDFVKKLGITGFQSASWKVKEYDNWFGIPPSEIKKYTFENGEISKVSPIKSDYTGNGATSFVTFKENLNEKWIKFENSFRDKDGKITKGIDATMNRELLDTKDVSHIGFTYTPWYENGKLGYWWITNEIAFNNNVSTTENPTIKSLKEIITFKIN